MLQKPVQLLGPILKVNLPEYMMDEVLSKELLAYFFSL